MISVRYSYKLFRDRADALFTDFVHDPLLAPSALWPVVNIGQRPRSHQSAELLVTRDLWHYGMP